ncbi:MAG: YggS family pyridoxal phosphate-dependent enzyme [Candidatus Koribacter versatilis]|uniref:Pyridoxal phosphate homeostasis protein n=1 Tax=Candidatus Korobacter versatilis TaxID=658062 RepID=A0A932EQH5_9BACT|nr:YggS family pyridoxal phosphate-dependent enzyme [Candidatus Koribacter versatilis]
MSIATNIAHIQDRIANAAARAGRNPEDIQLMAVSKTFPGEAIAEAHAAGLRLFGENRVQEFAGKSWDVHNLAGAQFHLIGHLQSNKAPRALELFHAIDSVDSLRLAERLNAMAGRMRKRVPILLEINIGGEEQKAGLAPDSPELEQLLTSAPRLAALAIRGLMSIPPHTGDPEGARPYFRRLRALRDTLRARNLPSVSLDTLSIGMSHDFEVAVEEGSTCVRLGTAIFGERPRP